MSHILFGSIWDKYMFGFLVLGYQRHAFLQAVNNLAKRYDSLRMILTILPWKNMKNILSMCTKKRKNICERLPEKWDCIFVSSATAGIFFAKKHNELRQNSENTTHCDRKQQLATNQQKIGRIEHLQKLGILDHLQKLGHLDHLKSLLLVDRLCYNLDFLNEPRKCN